MSQIVKKAEYQHRERAGLRPGSFASCPLCGGMRIACLSKAVHIWKCPQCELVFRNPQPRDDELSSFYEESYSPKRIASGTTEMAGTTPAVARQYVRCLSKSIELKGRRVLEVGAGLGTLSMVLMEHGADAVAIEPFAARECRNAGITTYRSIGEIPQGMRFDLVVMVEVIEHLSLPWDTLRELKEFLKPSGWLFVTTPNAEGFSARMHGVHWREILKPGHLVFFTPKTLEQTLKEAGFHRCTRLKWFIRYADRPAKQVLHFLLQSLAVDGQLRYIAQKA